MQVRGGQEVKDVTPLVWILSAMTVALSFMYIGNMFDRANEVSACQHMLSSCPADRSRIMTYKLSIICTCNEDRSKP